MKNNYQMQLHKCLIEGCKYETERWHCYFTPKMDKTLQSLFENLQQEEIVQEKNRKYQIPGSNKMKLQIKDLERLKMGNAQDFTQQETRSLNSFHDQQRAIFKKYHKDFVSTRYCQKHYEFLKKMAKFRYYLYEVPRKFYPLEFVQFLKQNRNEQKRLFYLVPGLMKYYRDPNSIQKSNINDTLLIIKFYLKPLQQKHGQYRNSLETIVKQIDLICYRTINFSNNLITKGLMFRNQLVARGLTMINKNNDDFYQKFDEILKLNLEECKNDTMFNLVTVLWGMAFSDETRLNQMMRSNNFAIKLFKWFVHNHKNTDLQLMEVLLCFLGSCCVDQVRDYLEKLGDNECCNDDTLIKFFIDIEAKKDFLRKRVFHFGDRIIKLKEIVQRKTQNEQMKRIKLEEEEEKQEMLDKFYDINFKDKPRFQEKSSNFKTPQVEKVLDLQKLKTLPMMKEMSGPAIGFSKRELDDYKIKKESYASKQKSSLKRSQKSIKSISNKSKNSQNSKSSKKNPNYYSPKRLSKVKKHLRNISENSNNSQKRKPKSKINSQRSEKNSNVKKDDLDFDFDDLNLDDDDDDNNNDSYF